MRSKPNQHVFVANDFYPSWEKREENAQSKTDNVLLAKAEMLNAMFGGLDLRNQKAESA